MCCICIRNLPTNKYNTGNNDNLVVEKLLIKYSNNQNSQLTCAVLQVTFSWFYILNFYLGKILTKLLLLAIMYIMNFTALQFAFQRKFE